MAFMLIIYLPLMYYTKASYLMGAFLTGCSFALVDGAYHMFMEKTHQLMTWLLRVFFAATIGFQVPVQLYSNPYVVMWGFILYLCVVAKLPLGLFVPQFEDRQDGQNYNPLLRDRLVTGLSMTCRGEMSFIIAAFALGEGLISSEVYGSITWAVLLSCITSPFMLLNLIKYYNTKQKEYLASTNPLKHSEGVTLSSPLYLHVKVYSPTSWGIQDKFRIILNELGLEIVERRTNRDGRGLDARVTNDLFVRDATMNIHLDATIKSEHNEIKVTSSNEKLTQLEQAAIKDDAVISRCREIEKIIEELFGEDATVGVIVWNPFPRELSSSDLNSQLHEASSSEADESFFYTKIFDKMDEAAEGENDNYRIL